MLTVVVPLVVLANGLAAGVLVGTQLGGWPLLLALPPDRYVQAHAFFSDRFDPFMPTCLLVTVFGDLLLAATGHHAATRVVAGGAAALTLVAILISLTRNVPVNRWIRTLDPDQLPVDFRDPRPSWGRWNSIRTALVVAALLTNCGFLALTL